MPDTSVFLWNRIPRDENGEVANTFSTAPDWTIAILFPDQSQTRVTKNILHCLEHGTEVGWLIDSREQTMFIYRAKQEPANDNPEKVIPVPLLAGALKLTIKDLFA